MRIAPAVILAPEHREALEQHARSRSHAARVVERARIVLLAAEVRQNREIAAVLKITEKKAARDANDHPAKAAPRDALVETNDGD